MSRDSYRAQQATRVLQALGTKAARPSQAPKGVAQRLCRNPGCNVQIIVANLASGQWAPLERHPEGHIVLVDGVVRYDGPLTPGADRFVFHACRVGAK